MTRTSNLGLVSLVLSATLLIPMLSLTDSYTVDLVAFTQASLIVLGTVLLLHKPQ